MVGPHSPQHTKEPTAAAAAVTALPPQERLACRLVLPLLLSVLTGQAWAAAAAAAVG